MNFKGGVIFFKAKIFLIACLVFIGATGLASFLPKKILSLEIWWFITAVFFLLLMIFFWRFDGQTGLKPLSAACLLAAVLFSALWRYGLSLPSMAPDKIWYYNQAGQAKQTITFKGYVASEPDIRDTSQKLEVAVNSLKQAPGRKISGKVLVTAGLYPEYYYGDEVEIIGGLERPEEFNGFAYDRYLARYDIYSVSYYPKIEVIGHGAGNILYEKIFTLKKYLSGLIDSGLTEPESSLARPIVFGGQQGLEPALKQDFQKVGLTHIMAVSGFNISILAAVVMACLLGIGLKRSQAFYAASIFLGAYVILVGAPASATRAGLMGFLVLWALKLGRFNKITNALVLTAAILLLINPRLLRDDVGFQLSFLAIGGLVYVYPILEALYLKSKLPRLKGLSDALLITLAAQVFTWPILAYDFSQVSLIAPLANLAVLWVLPLLTILILVGLPLAAILPGLAAIFFLPSLILTKYILAMVKTMAAWPYGYVQINYLWWGWVVIYYLAAVTLIIKIKQSKLLKPVINDKI